MAWFRLFPLLVVSVLAGIAAPAWSALPEAVDLQADAAQSRRDRLPIVLFFHSLTCPYCRRVEEDYLSWLLRENVRHPRFVLRAVEIGSSRPVKSFDGSSTDMRSFARQRGVRLVPHLQFVGPDGMALAEDLIGLNPPDFYGSYLESAVQQAYDRLRSKTPR